MTKYHKWTEAETSYIRRTYNLPAGYVAHELGLTESQVRNKRSAMRAKDRSVNINKKVGNINDMDGRLKQFQLFGGAYTARRSLWQRIRAFFVKE